MKPAAVLAVAALALASAGCGDDRPQTVAASPPPATAGGEMPPAAGQPAASSAALPGDRAASPAGASTDPQVFMAMAASSSALEVAAARLAQDKATSPAVKTYAGRMATEHARMSEELRALAAAKNMTLGDRILPTHQAELDQLAMLEGAAFDQAFAQRVGVQSHMSTVNLFEQAAGGMKDPEVRAFAEQSLIVMREHLDEAQRLVKDVGAKS